MTPFVSLGKQLLCFIPKPSEKTFSFPSNYYNLQLFEIRLLIILKKKKRKSEVLQHIMDTVKNAAKAATGQDSQFTAGKTFFTIQSLIACIDPHHQVIKFPSKA